MCFNFFVSCQIQIYEFYFLFTTCLFYLLLLIVKYILSDSNISPSAVLYLYFLGFSFPNPESVTIKMSGWKLPSFILDNKVSTQRYFPFWTFIFFRGRISNILPRRQKCCRCYSCMGQKCSGWGLLVVHTDLHLSPFLLLCLTHTSCHSYHVSAPSIFFSKSPERRAPYLPPVFLFLVRSKTKAATGKLLQEQGTSKFNSKLNY